jgi:hypothetical protein
MARFQAMGLRSFNQRTTELLAWMLQPCGRFN